MKRYLKLSLIIITLAASPLVYSSSALTPPITPTVSAGISRSNSDVGIIASSSASASDLFTNKDDLATSIWGLAAPEEVKNTLDPRTLELQNQLYKLALKFSLSDTHRALSLLQQASVCTNPTDNTAVVFPEALYAQAALAYNDDNMAAANMFAFQTYCANYYRQKTTKEAQELDKKISNFCALLIEEGETNILLQLFAFHSAQAKLQEQLPTIELCACAYKPDSQITTQPREFMTEAIIRMLSGLSSDDLIAHAHEIQKHTSGLQYIISNSECPKEHQDQLRTVLNQVEAACQPQVAQTALSKQPVIAPKAVATTTTSTLQQTAESLEEKINRLKSELDKQAQLQNCTFEQWLQKIDSNQIIPVQEVKDALFSYFSHSQPVTTTANRVWLKIAPLEFKAQVGVIHLKSNDPSMPLSSVLEALLHLDGYVKACNSQSKISAQTLFDIGIIYLLASELPILKKYNIGTNLEKASEIAQLLVQKGTLEGNVLGFLVAVEKEETTKAEKRFKQIIELLATCSEPVKVFEYYRTVINYANSEQAIQLEPAFQTLLDANYLPAHIFNAIQLFHSYPKTNDMAKIEHGMTIIIQALESSNQQLAEVDEKDMTQTLSDAVSHAMKNNKTDVPNIMPFIKQLKDALNSHNARFAKQ